MWLGGCTIGSRRSFHKVPPCRTDGQNSLHAFYYQAEPVFYPPIYPIPGRDAAEGDNSGITWPAHPLPHYMGMTFTAMCEFWKIAQEIISVYFGSTDSAPLGRVPLAFAESRYQKLLEWTDKLHENMQHRKGCELHLIMVQLVLFTPK